MTKSPSSSYSPAATAAAETSIAVEMIDQALSPMAIELQPLVEVFLLEDDAVVNAGHVASMRPIRRRGPRRDRLLRGG